jgi:histidinol-phosphatase (PHP family)
MLIDYHLHNHFSPDSREDTREIVKKALEMGVKNLCITNHAELHERETGMSVFDFDEAVERFRKIEEELDEVRKEYRQADIRLGVELEYYEGRMDEIARFTEAVPLDFILGSVHVVMGVIISSHLFADGLYKKTDEETAYNAYFDNLEKLVEWGHLDAVAHFDICKKIGCRFYGPFQPEKYKHRIIPILETMKKQGIGLELNTKCVDNKCREIFPHPLILKWAVEAGIENFTLGSDAHKKEHVSQHLEKARQLAKNAGVKYLSTYSGRKAKLNPI